MKSSGISFFFLLLFISLHTLCQAQELVIKSDIVTTKTAAHQNIEGTKLWMIPPQGYQIMRSTPGLYKSDYSFILMSKMSKKRYESTAKEFTKEGIEKKGVGVLEIKELTINGFPAKMAKIIPKGKKGKLAIELIYGDPDNPLLIVGSYQTHDKRTETEIIQAIESMWVDKQDQE